MSILACGSLPFDGSRSRSRCTARLLPWSLLLHGFTFEGTRVPLLSQQGIFKPKVLTEIRLTVTIVPDSGTGELAGILGTLEIDHDEGKHSYVPEYEYR